MTVPLRHDYDEFLFAPIAVATNGLPLTVVSILARLDVDPWDEAASLARLPREPAEQRLVLLLEALPEGTVPPAERPAIASRLVAMLHRPTPPGVVISSAPAPVGVVKPRRIGLAIYCLIALILMLAAHWFL